MFLIILPTDVFDSVTTFDLGAIVLMTVASLFWGATTHLSTEEAADTLTAENATATLSIETAIETVLVMGEDMIYCNLLRALGAHTPYSVSNRPFPCVHTRGNTSPHGVNIPLYRIQSCRARYSWQSI